MSRLARPWLVADMGGTNARFGWLAAGAAGVTEVHSLPAASHAGPAEAAQAYLAWLAGRLGARFEPPHAAAFAVATAVGDDRVELTNSHWAFSCRDVQARLGLERLVMLNDFEALALALPGLGPGQVEPIGAWQGAGHPSGPPDQALARSTRAVIGPGTGLGVGALVWSGAGWVAVPGEGGHATLAPADDFESALLAAVRREFEHVSAERLLSGLGLPLLHRAVGAVLGTPAAAPLTAEQVVGLALAGSDPVAVRAVQTFCALLGGFAGNVALTLGARGGVYIGGGIVPRLGAAFAASPFRARFEAKGRLAGYLRAVPTWLITDTLAALGGAAAALEQA